jgi:hypothetical protein
MIYGYNKSDLIITRGSQEPVIAHLVFNLTSKVDRKWECSVSKSISDKSRVTIHTVSKSDKSQVSIYTVSKSIADKSRVSIYLSDFDTV